MHFAPSPRRASRVAVVALLSGMTLSGLVTAVPTAINDTYSTLEEVPLSVGGSVLLTANFDTPNSVSFGAQWSYLNTLPNTAGTSYPTDGTGQGWNTPSFDTATSTVGPWATGAQPFGSTQASQPINYYTNNGITPTQVLNGLANVTTYLFRNTFTLTAAEAAQANWTFRYLFDDSAVIWINGQEAARVNLPNAPTVITPLTFANASGNEDTLTDLTVNLTGKLFPGVNTIAIELHQASTLSDSALQLALFPAVDTTGGFAYTGNYWTPTSNDFDTGTFDTNTGYNNTAAMHVNVGGRTPGNATVMPLSGAYTGTINAPTAGTYSINLRYRGTATAHYDANEFVEGICQVDTTRLGSVAADGGLSGSGISLFRFVGDGNNGAVPDTGWQQANLTVSLAAGNHTLVLGLYNSTSSGGSSFPEISDVYFDDIVFGTAGAGTGSGVLVNDTGGVAPVTAVKDTNPAHGTVVFNSDGSFTYTPALNFFGADTFTYHAVDGTGSSNVATVTINVTNVNDGPTGAANSYSTNEDTPLNVAAPGVLGNDTDPDGDTLSAVVRSQPAHGTLTLNSNGSFTYNPAANYNGPDSFTYRATDGTLNSTDQTVSLTVTAVNDPPTGVADAYRTLVNTPLDVNLTSSGGQGTTTQILVAAGSLVALGAPEELDLPEWRYLDDGTDPGLTWRDPGFNDSAWLIGKAELGYGDAADGRLERTVVGFGPNSSAKYPTTYFRTYFTVVDKGTLSSLAMRLMRDDAAAVYLNGTEIYRDQSANGYPDLPANPAYNAYCSGSVSNADEATLVNLTTLLTTNAVQYLVEGPNVLAVEVHQANGSSSDVSMDIELTAQKAPYVGVLANDSDAEGATLTAQIVTNPAHGTLTLNADGTFLYTPAASYIGADSFVYRAYDGAAQSANTTVSLTVISEGNIPPAAADDAYSTPEDTTLTVNAPGLLGNDTDPEAQSMTAQLLTTTSHGTLTLNADGSFTYQPEANYNGPDSFTYRAKDSSNLPSAAATVSITVTAGNDPPVAVADSYGTNPSTTLSVPVGQGVLANDSDIDGNPLTAVLVTGPTSGTLNLASNGSFTYTPPVGFSGTQTFTYRANDGTANSATTTVTIVINGAPIAQNNSYSTNEDAPLTISAPGVLGNDSDPESSPLTAQLATQPAHGSVTLNADGSFSYFPSSNYAGADSFTYAAFDGSRLSAPATVSLTVTAVNDAPDAGADNYSTPPNQTLSIPATSGILSNDSDAEGTALTLTLVSTTANGTLSLLADGSFTYSPTTNFVGTDTFTYQISDGSLSSAVTTVQILVEQKGTDIVINEIMYRPGATYPEPIAQEYIELHNRGTSPIDLTGWQISSGVSFAFPAGRIMAPGSYLVIAANLSSFQAAHPGVTNVIGPWTGSLSNDGETIALMDSHGEELDKVHYASDGDWAQRVREATWGGWDWSSLANGGGRSMELRNPQLSNDNGQNWIISTAIGGTPGAANGALTSNIPPIIKAVEHFPAVPKPTDTVRISCELNDESPDTSLFATLHWRDATSTSPGAFQTLPMSWDGGNGWFAPLDPKVNLSLVEFYISATDGVNTRTWPAPTSEGQNANCQYQVDGSTVPTWTETVRLVLTAAENSAYNNVSSSSDRQFNQTLVITRGAEQKIRYRCDMRIRGNSSRSYQFRPMRVSIPADDALDGTTGFNLNPKAPFLQHLGMRLFQAAGLHAPDTVPVAVRRNGVNYSTSSGSTPDYGYWVRMEDIGGEFVKNHWVDGADTGNVYKKGRNDYYWRATEATPSNPATLLDGWSKQNNGSANDWSDLTNFFSVWMSASAPYFPASNPLDVAGSGGNSTSGIGNWDTAVGGGAFTTSQVNTLDTVADLDQWAKWLAVMTILQDNETNLSNGQDDDYAAYFEPRTVGVTVQRRMQLLPHDLDTIFGLGDNPLAYNDHGLYDATAESFVFRPLLPLLGNSTSTGNAAFRTKYFDALRLLLGTLFDADNTSNPNPPFYQFVDYQLGNWAPAATRVVIKDFARQRRTYLLGLMSASATTPPAGTSNATVTSAHGALTISEILANNVASHLNGGLYPDVVELRNTGASAVSLTGKSLTDDALNKVKYVFPAGVSIPAGGYLILYADSATTAPGLHLGFNLDADGDMLQLYDTVANGQTLLDSITFGLQAPDLTIGRTGAALDTWALCTPTLGSANTAVATLAAPSSLRINEWLGNADYRASNDFIELYNPAAQPVALGGMSLTDDFINLPTRAVLPPLSFMAATSFVAFEAKGTSASPGNARELPFNIGSIGGSVALLGVNGSIVDKGETLVQFRDVATGRLPDGTGTWASLSPPSPGFSNATLSDTALDVLNYLRITELMYNTASTAQSEYIEFRNTSDLTATPVTLDLSGVTFKNGITYTFPGGTSLAPGAYYVIVGELAKFQAQFPGVATNGTFTSKLDNGGEHVSYDIPGFSIAVLDFTYNDAWYPSTDGGGDALQIVNPGGSPAEWDTKAGWQAAPPSPGAGSAFGVHAGPDLVTVPSTPTYLDGALFPGSASAGTITLAWTKDSGPGTVSFSTANYQDANASFSLPGTYVLRLTATAPGPQTTSDTITVTVQETYTVWAARVLAAQSAANQLPTADPDNDGVTNVAEFVLGSDPLNATSVALPTVTTVGGRLSILWQRSKTADATIQVIPQLSADLQLWEEGASVIETIPTGGTATTEFWQSTEVDPFGTHLRRFMRLLITMP